MLTIYNRGGPDHDGWLWAPKANLNLKRNGIEWPEFICVAGLFAIPKLEVHSSLTLKLDSILFWTVITAKKAQALFVNLNINSVVL